MRDSASDETAVHLKKSQVHLNSVALYALIQSTSVHRATVHMNYPIKNYRGLSPSYSEKRWAYVHLIRGAAHYPIILSYEACKYAYLCMYSK